MCRVSHVQNTLPKSSLCPHFLLYTGIAPVLAAPLLCFFFTPCAHCVSCACIPFQPGTNSNHREGERVGLQLSLPNLRALSNLAGCTQSRFPRSFAHAPATLVPVWALPSASQTSMQSARRPQLYRLLLDIFSDPDPSSRAQLCFHASWQR